jgi:hypothetical protein
VKWAKDPTGRFVQRPFWLEHELDVECEGVVTDFLTKRHGRVAFPISTEDLTVMLEASTEDFDPFADLSALGEDVDGVTIFLAGRRPSVRINSSLAADSRRTNRYRTTLTHEYGHVKLHRFLWDFSPAEGLFGNDTAADRMMSCRRNTIVAAPTTDWMEWQAGYASGALLMPATRMAAVVTAFQRQAGRVGPLGENAAHADELVVEVQRSFQVSEEAARVRLSVLRHFVKAALPEVGLFAPEA